MAKEIKLSKKSLTDVFSYLDQLRMSGITNMYASGSYVVAAFSWPQNKASRAVSLWMQTFAIDEPMKDRVEKAIKENVDA